MYVRYNNTENDFHMKSDFLQTPLLLIMNAKIFMLPSLKYEYLLSLLLINEFMKI